MRSILNEPDRAEISNRLASLSKSSTRRWGSMDVVSMLQHLRLSARMTLGELAVPSSNKRAFQMFPLKHLIIYVLPFPKGAPTAPELKPAAATSFEDERAALLELLERIGTGPEEGAGPAHPLFGPMTWREWGVTTYKHADHHLKQFGA
ncbi:MAG TPA: DUF1569 domain-containing protein [Pyrinomonadaceae bacterium]|nr:DUF1569 domain-containing protein [Pyrinomonadaceae bacterium]